MLIFDRAGLGGGVMKMEWTFTPPGGALTNVVKIVGPRDHGQSLDFGVPASEAAAKAKYGPWLLSVAENNTRRNDRADNKANNRKRKF